MEDSFHSLVVKSLGRSARVTKNWDVLSADPWVVALHKKSVDRRQGWKLHISGSTNNCESLLKLVVPYLSQTATRFKVTASPGVLTDINQGHHGASQVGKFVTIYPPSDELAVRMAQDLHGLTKNQTGPRIRSDRRLARDSLVYYRFGAFDAPYLQTSLGQMLPALEDPSGSPHPDFVGRTFRCPDWVVDPFRAAGVAHAEEPTSLLIADRYLIVGTKSVGVRATVYVVIDSATGEPLILKQAANDLGFGETGLARKLLLNEASILSELSVSIPVPKVHNLLDMDDLSLITAFIDGRTLEQHVKAATAQARPPSVVQIQKWAIEILTFMTALHGFGVIHGDLAPSNIIVNHNGAHLTFIDFECARRSVESGVQHSLGTPGFSSPSRQIGGTSTPADDIYSFGATLYFLMTGVDPSLLSREHRLMDRPPSLFRHDLDPNLVELAAKCLNQEINERPKSAVILLNEFRSVL